MPSSEKFWNLKSLQGATFHTDHFGMKTSFCPKSDLDIYFIRLTISRGTLYTFDSEEMKPLKEKSLKLYCKLLNSHGK